MHLMDRSLRERGPVALDLYEDDSVGFFDMSSNIEDDTANLHNPETPNVQAPACGYRRRYVRIHRQYHRSGRKAEEMRNLALAAQLLEQAAKEMGDAYSRQRVELTGKNGGPIEHAVSAKDLTDDELAAIIATGGN